jgi:hypothetical protein
MNRQSLLTRGAAAGTPAPAPRRVFWRAAAGMALVLCALAFFLAPAPRGMAAQEPSGRVIAVTPQTRGGIGGAIRSARRGDTIRIAAGVYHEQLQVGVPGLHIEGALSEDSQPLVTLRPPAGGKGAPLIRDNLDTQWSGVALEGKSGILLELRGFSGTFSYCRFDLRPMSTFVRIYGGSPEFFGCTFLGATETVSTVQAYGQKEGASSLSFAYTLFRDFGGGAIVLKGDQALTATNCVFAACGFFFIREKDVTSPASALNSVFYLIASPQLVRQEEGAPKARLDTCVYTPAPIMTFFRWLSLPLEVQKELELENCVTASPRFKEGRQVFLNLCVDDARNLPLWNLLCEKMNRFSMPMTAALDTQRMTPEFWKIAAQRVSEGHEVATHSLTHTSMLAKDAIRLGYPEQANSATMSVTKDKELVISVDGKNVLDLDLAKADADLTLGKLVKTLESVGAQAQLTAVSLREIPARFLGVTTRQDILFPKYAVSHVLDLKVYLRTILEEPRRVVERNLKALGVADWQCLATVCPFKEFADALGESVLEAGYVLARGDTRKYTGNHFEHMRTLPLQDLSSADLFQDAPVPNHKELFRVLFDHLKYRGGAIGFYSHGVDEMMESEWEDMFALLAKDPTIKVMRLKDIAAEVAKDCKAVSPGIYSCPRGKYPNVGEVSFEPLDDSPLVGAGKATPYRVNYAGKRLPQGTAPNIGLY